jgi:hypothetical protein
VERTTLLLREWTRVVKGMFGGEGTRYAVVGESGWWVRGEELIVAGRVLLWRALCFGVL